MQNAGFILSCSSRESNKREREKEGLTEVKENFTKRQIFFLINTNNVKGRRFKKINKYANNL